MGSLFTSDFYGKLFVSGAFMARLYGLELVRQGDLRSCDLTPWGERGEEKIENYDNLSSSLGRLS